MFKRMIDAIAEFIRIARNDGSEKLCDHPAKNVKRWFPRKDRRRPLPF